MNCQYLQYRIGTLACHLKLDDIFKGTAKGLQETVIEFLVCSRDLINKVCNDLLPHQAARMIGKTDIKQPNERKANAVNDELSTSIRGELVLVYMSETSFSGVGGSEDRLVKFSRHRQLYGPGR